MNAGGIAIIVLVIIIIIVIIVTVVGFNWRKIIPEPKEEGDKCSLHTDCRGFKPGVPDTLACCQGVCKPQLKDWAGFGYCPEECKDSPGSPVGSCERGYTWPRSEGQPCNLSTDCDGYTVGGVGTLACCGTEGSKVCKKQLRDWAGVGYCPEECKDSPGSPVGSCERGYTWPRSDGQPCNLNTDCDGFRPGGVGTLACCGTEGSKVCKRQLKDWAGVGYCPEECKRTAGEPAGSCVP